MGKPKQHLPLSITIAVIVHVVAVALLAVGYQAKRELAPSPKVVINTVKAKVIDAEELAENKKRRQEALRREELKRQQQLAEQKRREQEKLRQAEEKRRLQAELEVEKKRTWQAEQTAELERKEAEKAKAELEKNRLAEEAKRIAEQKKAAEARRLAEQKKVAEAKRLVEQKKAAEAKKLAEQKKAAEAKRLAELKKRKEQEEAAIRRQRLASLEKEEAEMKAAELEAQRLKRAREMRRLIAEYQDAIRNKIERNWLRPPGYQSNAWCKVLVQQVPGGGVKNVVVEECMGNDAFRESVEKAVWKSDPLPEPPSPELFDQELRFTFNPRV